MDILTFNLHFKVGGSLNKKDRGFVCTVLIIRIPASASWHQTHTPDEGQNKERILEKTRQETDTSYRRLSRDEPCRAADTPPPPSNPELPCWSTQGSVWGGAAELKKKEPLLLCLGVRARGPMQATVSQNETRSCFMKIITVTQQV